MTTTSDLGRVRPIYRGAYSPAYSYTPLDFLTYAGHTYFCVQVARGVLPTNALYFQPVVEPEGLVTADDLASAMVIVGEALALRLRIDAPQPLTLDQKKGLWAAQSVVPRLSSGAALPTEDIGPIWHDGYASVLTWRTIGEHTGYASVDLGVVGHCAGKTPPPGTLERNGAAISRTTYAALFGLIGTTWGAGDGTTTFNLPDDRGLFDRGWDHGRGVDSGRVFGSSQTDAIQNITGTWSAAGAANWQTATGAFAGLGSGIQVPGSLAAQYVPGSMSFDASRVARTAVETRPYNRAYLPTIKY